ncbi:PAS domain-containing sensor histidine kinase [Neobacillus fumarioli]|uniref:PAS domain-containing sensor histidine kinase n=1 Tax=Neobacillus fumarioli TaxID=105229 RepID=UPI00082A3069|nr:ATP-binding protein [Neobacillus fumarioli]
MIKRFHVKEPVISVDSLEQKSKPMIELGKETIESLKASEQMYWRIFEDSIDGMLLWNNELRIVDANCMAEKMYKLPKEQMIGQKVYELINFPQEIEEKVFDHLKQVLQKGKHSSSIVIEIKDGKKRHYEYSSKLEIVQGLNFTVIKDVTAKARIEEQLRKSETLNVIGELAAGIAHEIRNPMTALKGFIQLLEGSIKEEHSMYYQVITSELQRVDSIINEFLLLAKPQAIKFQEKDVIQIMKETIDLLNAQAVLHNVQFSTIFDDHLPPIFCEPNQLKKVFVNLIKNAIEVMPNGGTITVKISGNKNNQIHISIKDEGIGIPKEKLKRLGEPFYTTKERGTGLGLMVSYRIIEEHKGNIQIESQEGKGSTFHIYLPIHLHYDMPKTTSI